MSRGAKSKLNCLKCGASYMLDLSRVPPDRKAIKCLKCGAPVPILGRVLAAKNGQTTPDQEAAAQRAAQAKQAQTQDTEGPEPDLDYGPPPAEGGEEGEAWLAIYGDMMSILVIFFVLMFSISTIDQKKFSQVMGAVSEALDAPPAVVQQVKALALNAPEPADPMRQIRERLQRDDAQLEALRQQLEGLVSREELQNQFSLKVENDGLKLIGQDLAMFDSGQAQVRDQIHPFLLKVGKIINEIPNQVMVEGHTDNVPINTPLFASNWELSVMRATNVVRYLVNQSGVDPRRLTAAGYAEFRPRFPFDGPNNASNRRIEIVIKKRFGGEDLQDLLQPAKP